MYTMHGIKKSSMQFDENTISLTKFDFLLEVYNVLYINVMHIYIYRYIYCQSFGPNGYDTFHSAKHQGLGFVDQDINVTQHDPLGGSAIPALAHP